MVYFVTICLLIPFVGTMIGVIMLFFLKKELNPIINSILNAFSSGIMIAASIWSLILPSIEMTGSFIQSSIGFALGILFLILIDSYKVKENNSNMIMFSVTLHNIPEGMVVGALIASLIADASMVTKASVLSLALGIAIQNIPEGAIISLPLKSKGYSNKKAFKYGFISAIVEPIFGLITILLLNIVIPVLPFLLSFAAGAMIYVVINELIPESHQKHKFTSTISFTIGFLIMMILDVALG